MRLKKDSTTQKLRGAYYTPLQLANAMVKLVASQDITTVLEPSCGDGVFLEAMENMSLLEKVNRIVAVEIEHDVAEKVRCRYADREEIEVFNEDFLTAIIECIVKNTLTL
ncbi:MAG: N-6 DNA methylase [Clostridiales bacterium]|nr:N-6 DNA methylase [Clostridiales bacterium]